MIIQVTKVLTFAKGYSDDTERVNGSDKFVELQIKGYSEGK